VAGDADERLQARVRAAQQLRRAGVAGMSEHRPAMSERARRLAPFAAVAVTGLLAVVVPGRSDAPATASAIDPAASSPTGLPETSETTILEDPDAPATFATPAVALPRTSGAARSPSSSDSSARTTATSAPRSSGGAYSRPAPPPVVPTTIREFGWASARAGTGSVQPPENGMPVSYANGPDTISFARLAGTQSVLTLPVVQDANATYLPQGASIAACPLESPDWEAKTDVPLDEAPEWNETRCVPGKPASDYSSWTFNMLAYHQDAMANGIVLAIGPSNVTPTWQVTLDAKPPS
jgi:hypothetical protein